MGIRETVNNNPALTAGVTIGIIVLTVGIIVWSTMGGGPSVSSGGQEAFFTIDDGKTWFSDDLSKLPPFTKDGKEAVRAFVFSCNGTKKVVYMQRFTPEAKKKMEAAAANKTRPDLGMADAIQFTGVEVKDPGGKAWVKQSDPQAMKIMKPDCPNGTLELVSP